MLIVRPVSRGARVRVQEARSMAEYSGVNSRTSCPWPCRYLVSAAVTSARPPVLANGAASEAMAQILTGMGCRIPVGSRSLVTGAVVLATTVADRTDPGGDLRDRRHRRRSGGQLAELLPPLVRPLTGSRPRSAAASGTSWKTQNETRAPTPRCG